MERQKLIEDANTVCASIVRYAEHGKVKAMLVKLKEAGMPRADRRTSLIHMLNTPEGHAYGADAGRAWAVLQP